jgi:hypothetical protein
MCTFPSSTNNFAHLQTLSRMSSLSGRMNIARVNIECFTGCKRIKQRRISFVLGYLRMISWKISTAISIKHRLLATFNKNKKFNSDSLYGINVREYRRGNQKWKIQRNWQQCTQSEGKTKHNTICVGHHYTQRNTNSVNKTWALLQTVIDTLRIPLKISGNAFMCHPWKVKLTQVHLSLGVHVVCHTFVHHNTHIFTLHLYIVSIDS